MNTVYLFDVDGTLTPARQPMDQEFQTFFTKFCERFPVYLITGSDRPKLNEQVPPDLRRSAVGIFTCAGCQFWNDDTLIYERTHDFDAELVKTLDGFIEHSPFDGRYGSHMEFRAGMINVSIPGRNISQDGRLRYYKWDKAQGERQAFVKTLSRMFPNYSAAAGGQISIDVSPLGWTKAQVLKNLKQWHPASNFAFFGDRMNEGGNDRPLADALAADSNLNKSFSVDGPSDTQMILEKIKSP